jgi:osmoprotectant transport system ATP-binding protein
LFKLIDISKQFGSAPAVQGVSLEVLPNRSTVLIGPSGCGKSTLLRLMTGLIQPDGGAVLFDGEPLVPARLGAVRLRIGYVIQEGGIFPHLTGLGNVTLMARHLRRPPDDVRRRVEELCALTRLPHELLSRFPAEMSGGQRQRVALMRALMLDPDVLLLDEPLASLDPMVRFDLQNDLAQIFRSLNKTVVLVTHDINEAGFFGDVIVLMRAGRIVQQGTLPDLLQRPVEPFVEQFVRAQRGPLATHA